MRGLRSLDPSVPARSATQRASTRRPPLAAGPPACAVGRLRLMVSEPSAPGSSSSGAAQAPGGTTTSLRSVALTPGAAGALIMRTVWSTSPCSARANEVRKDAAGSARAPAGCAHSRPRPFAPAGSARAPPAAGAACGAQAAHGARNSAPAGSQGRASVRKGAAAGRERDSDGGAEGHRARQGGARALWGLQRRRKGGQRGVLGAGAQALAALRGRHIFSVRPGPSALVGAARALPRSCLVVMRQPRREGRCAKAARPHSPRTPAPPPPPR